MEIITRAARLQAVANNFAEEQRTIGFVPTMGALHEGHLSLVREARRMADAVVVSIFANPIHVSAGERLDHPRDLAKDADLLTPIGIDGIFAPPVEEVYPKGFLTWIEVSELSNKLEGISRPGYFRGAMTALTIFFNLLHPKFVFMGQKNAQQTLITKKLVRDLHLPIEIVLMPTVRESDGLALSSSNQYLSPEERRAAPVLYQALSLAEQMFSGGERRAAKLSKAIRKTIANEPHARLDYLAITDTERLDPLESLSHQHALISLAAYLGQTRLADNVILNGERSKSKSGRPTLG